MMMNCNSSDVAQRGVVCINLRGFLEEPRI